MLKSLLGRSAEARAEAWLVSRGLAPVTRNWRCRFGEIDLVMRDGATLVFVEVRARAGAAFGDAAESITTAKQARIILAARHYLARHDIDAPCRFDAVLFDAGATRWIKSAFEA